MRRGRRRLIPPRVPVNPPSQGPRPASEDWVRCDDCAQLAAKLVPRGSILRRICTLCGAHQSRAIIEIRCETGVTDLSPAERFFQDGA